MYIKLSLLILGLLAFFFQQEAKAQVFEGKVASVKFKIKNAGLSVDGSFGVGAVQITFSSADPEKSTLSGSVSSNSIKTGIAARDKHLKKSDYFDVANFPTISMTGLKVSATSPDHHTGRFKLSLKGVTKEIEIPIVTTKSATGITLSTTFTINRLDFKIGGDSFLMSDDVEITILAPLKPQV